MKVRKITSLGWWNTLRTILKYSAYIIIIFEGIQQIMSRIEDKDGMKSEPDNLN